MNQITDRGTEKRLYTKFHTMDIMRSGARVLKQNISRACRNHAFGIHESRHSPPSCKKKFCGLKFENKNTEIQQNLKLLKKLKNYL